MNFLLIHKHHQEIHRKCLTTRRFGQPRTIPTSSAKEAVKSTWTLLTHPLSGGRTILYLEAEKYNIMKTCLGHFFVVFTLSLTRIMQSWRSALKENKSTFPGLQLEHPRCRPPQRALWRFQNKYQCWCCLWPLLLVYHPSESFWSLSIGRNGI